jgi:glycosyltransferase involved in cell wall biosynthesis
MRIAQVAPLYEAVPPKLYGGTERVVAHLCDALVQRGHEVSLFASGESKTLATLVPSRETALRLDNNPLSWDLPAHLAMLAEVRERIDEFDLVHFHLDCFHFPMFSDVANRTLTTVHGRQDIGDLRRLHAYYANFPLVSISDSQRRPAPGLRWIRTIYHGYPLSQYKFSPVPREGYLAFLGRIAPEKGADRAIMIAELTGQPLHIAAKVDFADRAYFDGYVRPLLERSSTTLFVGEINEAQKSRFLGEATALLFPIDWPEPFGLVMIEAMACGTPVIAFNRGSVSEIIDDGVTGYIVETVEEAAAATELVSRLDRSRIRASFERRFSAEAMAESYEAAYRTVLAPSDGYPFSRRSAIHSVAFTDGEVAA